MSQKIVQINLKSNVPSQELQQAWLPEAPYLSETDLADQSYRG